MVLLYSIEAGLPSILMSSQLQIGWSQKIQLAVTVEEQTW